MLVLAGCQSNQKPEPFSHRYNQKPEQYNDIIYQLHNQYQVYLKRTAFFEKTRIEGVLKEQEDIFNSQYEGELCFREWFIENYIIPKYFTH